MRNAERSCVYAAAAGRLEGPRAAPPASAPSSCPGESGSFIPRCITPPERLVLLMPVPGRARGHRVKE